MNKKPTRLVPLNFSCGTLITQDDIDQIYREAYSIENGSRARKAFLAYARQLEKKLEKQKNFGKEPKNSY